MANNREFYLGRKVDLGKKTITDESVMYDPADLTTHMFVTGMTGSGKTGLCISLMEEAALQGIPAIIIDPKGDLTNLLLHFPDFLASDFEPWIDPEAARREGKTTGQLATDTAATWQKGLQDWGITSETVRALKMAAEFAIYTPGSNSGIPVNILSSFAAPGIDWNENQEVLRERIASSITALLGLIGYSDIDPLSSREHILLSNIMEHFWSQNISFDLTDLILKTQEPPFERLGAFPIEKLFPEKERFALAMKLNNFLASPSFQTWLTGQTLDVQQLLFSPSGKPRHSVFYLAHLSENERMFFVTLLYGAVETWMRRQSGTIGLRALVYFDEIVGYLPPISRPPSHTIMLRMLKQARAFGVGMILTSQNPVDLDYKALSNAGTWMIGRLQTDQDKQRLMDGLQSASGSIDRNEADKLLSNLGKRVFVLHNVHSKGLTVFNTRWAMNYLAGPMTRNQLSAMNALVGASLSTVNGVFDKPVENASANSVSTSPSQISSATEASSKRPVLPSGIDEFFLPNSLTLENAARISQISLNSQAKLEKIVYHPTLLAQAEVRYLDRKYNLQTIQQKTALVEVESPRMIRWEDFLARSVLDSELASGPIPQVDFQTAPAWVSDLKNLKSLQADFLEWVYRNASVQVRANETLKLFVGPEISSAEFRKQCSDTVREKLNAEMVKLKTLYEKKLDALEDKLEKEKRDVKTAETKLDQRRMEELGTTGELVLSFLSSRKKSISSSLTKRRMTSQAKATLEEEKLDVEQAQRNLDALEAEMIQAVRQLESDWANKANDIIEISISPLKKDVFMQTFGVAWLPYYIVNNAGQRIEFPAFNTKS
jgi:hypothetical protein